MWPSPKAAFLLLTAHSLLVSGSPVEAELVRRQCPSIHVFGARETTVAQGYGTSATVVNLILNAYPGSTAEAIVYPACGGQSSCGGVSYGNSASQGTAAVAAAVNKFYASCPSTQLVLVGYSQGGQIMDNAYCGGPDSGSGITSTTVPISAAALNQVKAIIEMGSPRFVAGLSYNVGTCAAQGFAPRPSGYVCPSGGSKIQSYCDAADPYCCTGSDQATHQGYGNKYGQQALAFVKSKLSATSGGGTTTPTTTAATSTPTTGTGTGTCAALWGQCGGTGWSGAKCCSTGTCKVSNAYYSQCLN
ncbi:carbohydrate esterase family 5 protein [Podospora didyma]|uniref:Carbohydrate esterase family 5 protein n=1 Tax=Podospora didyma TaxID=330526 RepID=A0AAE0N1P9_9PEZI|nr:carbohydrate esterase family 5 protein [Podospora didyma]